MVSSSRLHHKRLWDRAERGGGPLDRLRCGSHAARDSHLRATVAAPEGAAQETKPSNAEAISRFWLTAVGSGGAAARQQ